MEWCAVKGCQRAGATTARATAWTSAVAINAGSERKMLIPLWLRAALVGIVMVGMIALVKHWEAGLRQEGYDKAVAEYQAQKEQALAEAQAVAKNWRTKYEKATDEIVAKSAEIARLSALNRAAVGDIGRLRDKLRTATDLLPRDSVAACAKSLAAVSTVLGECIAQVEEYAGAYGELATQADGHAADVRMMEATWPRQ